MKKTVKKVMAVCLACVCLAFACVLPSFAALVPGRFYYSTDHYTARTNTPGSSVAYFAGSYYGENSTANTALVQGECVGGPKNQFDTVLIVRFLGMTPNTVNSNVMNTNSLTLTQSANSNSIQYGEIGYVEVSCTGKTDLSDKWQLNYDRIWLSASQGWGSRQ